MKKPVVGITHADAAFRDNEMRVRTYCTHKYYWAVQRAGATAILLPAVESEEEMWTYLKLVDGLLLPGGEDIDPRYQQESPSPKLGLVNPWRDSFELGMARMAYENRIPTLGICRGIQVMAVANGGSVYQDIGTEAAGAIQHSQNAPRWSTIHEIKIKSGSQLNKTLGEKAVYTNSFHHQAVKKMPKGFQATAHTSDGIIEAIEAPGFFYLGVQWHPEELAHCDQAARKLFEGFVGAL